MSEEKRMILEMLNNGDINVEEAERLLAAIPEEKENEIVVAPTDGGIRPKRLKVTVTDLDIGKKLIDIRIPFSLIKAGIKLGKASMVLGAKFDDNRDSDAQQVLELLKDIDVDEILNSIDDGEIVLPYTMIDMDNHDNGENQHVEVILE